MKKFKRLSNEDILNILYYRALGCKNSQIAEKFGCTAVNISYHVCKFRKLSEEGKSEEIFWKVVANRLGIDTVTMLKKLDLMKVV